MKDKIWFDMDGTIADLYAVEGWEEMLGVTHNPFPYETAEPMLNMSAFARLLHKAQRLGYEVCIVSWLAIGSNEEYDIAVTEAKLGWLNEHLPSVVWDEVVIVAHGTPKAEIVGGGWLFDDEEKNRAGCGDRGLEPCEILKFLRGLE